MIVVLDYEFDARSELDDFRARPGSVRVENGGVYPAGELGATTLESVYWLTPPLRVEGEVDPGTVLTLGFGDMRIVPRGQDEPVVWRAAPPGLPRRRSALGSESRYAFDLRLTRERVTLRTDESLHAKATSVPVRGRVLVRVESGGLRRLRIEGGLEMNWARERLRFLENRSPGDR